MTDTDQEYNNIQAFMSLFNHSCRTGNYGYLVDSVTYCDEHDINFENYIEYLVPPCLELVRQDKYDLLILIIKWLCSKNYTGLDIRILSHIYSDLCIKGNINFLQRVWAECNLIENTYLMPHECFERVFFACDPSIDMLQLMISYMEASNEYNEEPQEFADWLICSALLYRAENCARYLLNTFPEFISMKSVLSSIIGRNTDLFDLVYRLYNGNIEYNKMFSIAAGYGGLNMLLHLLNLFPTNNNTSTLVCAYALSRGKANVLQYILDNFQNINYNSVLDKTLRFRNERPAKLNEYNGFFQVYEKYYWEVSTNLELDYQACLGIFSQHTNNHQYDPQ